MDYTYYFTLSRVKSQENRLALLLKKTIKHSLNCHFSFFLFFSISFFICILFLLFFIILVLTILNQNLRQAVNYYHKGLHLGYCSSPRSATAL